MFKPGSLEDDIRVIRNRAVEAFYVVKSTSRDAKTPEEVCKIAESMTFLENTIATFNKLLGI